MLKGKSTIELRNAETGKIEQVVKDENMVTNAAYNLVNYPRLFSLGGKYPDIPNWITPTLNNCFGGILLFEKNITENANTILPQPDNENIGRAAGQYSGSDRYRGSLNISESKEINGAKGYRFVYDFPTDKGNGTIRSVCLTSYAGGTVGFQSEDFNINITSPFMNGLDIPNRLSGVFPREKSTTFDLSLVDSPPIGMFKENEITCITCNSGQTGLIAKVVKFQNSMTLKKAYNTKIQEKTISTTKKMNRPTGLSTDGKKIYSVFPYDVNKLDVVVFNGETLVIENEKTLVIQDAKFFTTKDWYYEVDAIYHSGYYYVKNNNQNGYYKINAVDTSDYKIILFDIQQGSPLGFYQLNSFFDYLILVNPSSQKCDYSKPLYLYYNNRFQKITFPQSGGQAAEVAEKFRTCEFVKLPYVLMTRESGNMAYISNIAPFLSTINNLTTPVVKNETQTMKVTYEITEV